MTSTLLGVLSACVLVACDAAPVDPPDLQTHREEEEQLMLGYIWGVMGGRQLASQDTDSATGVLSVEFQSAIGVILEHGVKEGLIQPPACGGLEMRERIPSDMVGGIHITPKSITVEVIPECEEAEQSPVDPEFDGAVDIFWDELVVEEYGTLCELAADAESETPSGLIMSCAMVEEYDESQTVTYPSRRIFETPLWTAEGERDCESYGPGVCRIMDMELWPTHPGGEAGETLVVECDETPWLCDLKVDLVDPAILVSGDTGEGGNTPMDDEECGAIVEAYNGGGACTAEVAECSLQGECSADTDAGWTSCTHDPATETTTCTECYHLNEDGSCGNALVTTTQSPGGEDDGRTNSNDVDVAKGGFKKHTGERGENDGKGRSLGGEYSPWSGGWKKSGDEDCRIVSHQELGDNWHQYDTACP